MDIQNRIYFLTTTPQEDYGDYRFETLISPNRKKTKIYKVNTTTVDKLISIGMLESHKKMNGLLTYEKDGVVKIGRKSIILEDNTRLNLLLAVSEYNTLNSIRDCRNVIQMDYTFNKEPIFGVDKENNLYLLIRTYYIPGEQLYKATMHNHISFHDIATITIAITETLEDLEYNNITHGDIKPSNIMYHSESKKATLIDFGTAFSTAELDSPFISDNLKLLLSERKELMENRIIGTADYFSPDHHQGNVTPQSDLFSFGLTLHNLITHINLSKKYRLAEILHFTRDYTNKDRDKLINEIYAATKEDSHFQHYFIEGIESALDYDPQNRNRAFLHDCADHFFSRKMNIPLKRQLTKKKSLTERIKSFFNNN